MQWAQGATPRRNPSTTTPQSKKDTLGARWKQTLEVHEKARFDDRIKHIKDIARQNLTHVTVKLEDPEITDGLNTRHIKELAKDGLLLWHNGDDWFIASDV